MTWFDDALGRCSLDPDDLGYLLARGAREERVHELGLTTWRQEACEARQGDKEWTRLGREGQGSRVNGMLTVPLQSARGVVLGADFRTTWVDKKTVLRHLLPEAAWCPTFVGLTARAADQLWRGADLWLVEGLFDMFALEWVVGARGVVLGCGRADLSQQQDRLLQRILSPTAAVYVVFDEDEAGRRGAAGGVDPKTGKYHRGAIARLRARGVRVVDVRYSAKDPGALWDAGGRPALQRAFGSLVLG